METTDCCNECVNKGGDGKSTGCTDMACPCHKTPCCSLCTAPNHSKIDNCHNPECVCHAKAPEKEASEHCKIVGHSHPKYICDYLSKPTTEAPTDEGWEKEFELFIAKDQSLKVYVAERPFLLKSFIASTLQKELAEEKKRWETADQNTYIEAYELGKSEAFSLVRNEIEKCLSENKESMWGGWKILHKLLIDLSTLEGK